MSYSYQEENKDLGDLYDQLCENHGDSIESVAWKSEHEQNIRYLLVSLMADLNHSTLLDVGCAHGKLLSYLNSEKIYPIYSGIDLSEKMIESAKSFHPDINIKQADFLDPDFNKPYDYIVACGAFNKNMPDHKVYTSTFISKMFHLCNKGVFVNFLSDFAPENRKYENTLFYHDPTEILKFCFGLTQHVVLKHDYLPHEFTVYLYK